MDAALPDIDDVEIEWMDLSVAASLALRLGHKQQALSAWRSAHALSDQFDENDPRHATSVNNLAVSYHLDADLSQAERTFNRAMSLWRSAEKWTACMQLPARARSSLFHLRLEQRHREHYDQQSRLDHKNHLLAGCAATLSGLAALLYSTGRTADARKLHMRALALRLRAALENDDGLAAMRRNIGKPPDEQLAHSAPGVELADFRTHALNNQWIIDSPPVFTDVGRLKCALHLAHIVSVVALDHR